METISDINSYIEIINSELESYITYIDSVSFTDENQKEYTTSEIIISNVNIGSYNSVQYLEDVKKDSLNEFIFTPIQDTTLINLCFETYGTVNDENIEKLIVANDLLAYNRTDIDPNNPIIKKGTEIKYYK